MDLLWRRLKFKDKNQQTVFCTNIAREGTDALAIIFVNELQGNDFSW